MDVVTHAFFIYFRICCLNHQSPILAQIYSNSLYAWSCSCLFCSFHAIVGQCLLHHTCCKLQSTWFRSGRKETLNYYLAHCHSHWLKYIFFFMYSGYPLFLVTRVVALVFSRKYFCLFCVLILFLSAESILSLDS